MNRWIAGEVTAVNMLCSWLELSGVAVCLSVWLDGKGNVSQAWRLHRNVARRISFNIAEILKSMDTVSRLLGTRHQLNLLKKSVDGSGWAVSLLFFVTTRSYLVGKPLEESDFIWLCCIGLVRVLHLLLNMWQWRWSSTLQQLMFNGNNVLSTF